MARVIAMVRERNDRGLTQDPAALFRARFRAEASGVFFCVYQGSSMSPLFRNGDVIQISPDRGRNIRRGDVVVFKDPEHNNAVVHRVCRVDPQGIQTRADNNRKRDPWRLQPEHILGRVTHAVGEKRKRVFGGSLGRFIGFALWVRKVADRWFSLSLRPLYHLFISLNVSRLWPSRWLKTRVVSFSGPSGHEFQLCLGRRMIGRWLPDENRWQIRPPFRLFVDKPALAGKISQGS